MNKVNVTWERLKNGPYWTYLFLGIQIIIYILMELTGLKQGIMNGSENVSILMNFGAITKYSIIVNHQYWRFVTPIFVHIGFFHLLLNSLSLYFVGRILEPLIGHWRYVTVYLLSGILGNLLSFGFGSDYSISAGASTSIFGIFAAFIVLGRIYPNHPAIQHLSRNMALLIAMNLIMNIFSTGVDMLGHIGGAIGGVLLMIMVGTPNNPYVYKHKIKLSNRLLSLVGFIGLVIFCLYKGFSY